MSLQTNPEILLNRTTTTDWPMVRPISRPNQSTRLHGDIPNPKQLSSNKEQAKDKHGRGGKGRWYNGRRELRYRCRSVYSGGGVFILSNVDAVVFDLPTIGPIMGVGNAAPGGKDGLIVRDGDVACCQ